MNKIHTMKLYSPEQDTGVVEETAEEIAAREAAAAAKQAEEEAARKAELEANKGKKEPETEEDEGLDLEGLEVLEDGRTKLTLGNSVYLSKDGLKGNAAVQDVWKQAREAEAAKDKAFRELKARNLMRPVAEKPVEKEARPEPPVRQQFVLDALRAAGIDPVMASWSDEQWDAYQEDKGLKDRHIVAIQNRISEAIKSGDARYQSENINWYNSTIIDDSYENIVEILTDAGVEPDQFADIYHTVLERVTADKKYQNEYGYIKSGQIEKEMTKEIMKVLKAKQAETVKTDLEKKHLEAERLKKANKAPGSGSAKLTVKDKPVLSLKEATERALAAIGKGAL